MSFPVGSDVIVLALNRRGRVVEARGASYRVLVGSITMTCREPELRAAEIERPGGGRRARPAAPTPDTTGAGDHRDVVRSIDLHGMTVEQAREAVIDFLSRAVMDGATRLEVVHGIGTGRVRDAVRRQLQSIAVVRAVRPHPSNPGVTIVEL